jgi:FlaA1/EpsC-like NDP-sugar epimerase
LAIFSAPAVAVPIFIYFGLYRSVIRYMSFKDVRAIVQAVSLYALVWGVITKPVTYHIVIPHFPYNSKVEA